MNSRRSHRAKAKLVISEAEIRRHDAELLPIVDNWLQTATTRAGSHLLCRPGCAQCCIGVFAIDRLDAFRLQRGLSELADRDFDRAQRVLQRAAESLERTVDYFPGDVETGILDESAEAEEIFEDFANDEPCPALDPETRCCDLYAHRPMTCRIYGPPVRTEGGIGVCELCFTKATPADIIAAEVPLDFEEKEAELNQRVEQDVAKGKTIVAFALLGA